MKKVVLVFGLISGLLISAWTVASMEYCKRNGFEGSMLVGYTAMVVAFSFVFVGVKNYRDKHNDGMITFGKAFLVGFSIAFIASTMYVIAWAIDYHYFNPDFLDKFSAHLLEKAHSGTASKAEVDAELAQFASAKEMYKSPVLFALITYAEILPPGIVVTLITALILRKRPKTAVLA